jgi:hypothetical protein
VAFNGVLFEIQRVVQTFGQLRMSEGCIDVDVLEMLSHYFLVRSRSTSQCLTRRRSG